MLQPQNPVVEPSAHGAQAHRLQVSVVKRYADFVALREQWEAVYDADPEAQFFLSWSFFSNWFEKGDDNDSGWLVLVVRAADQPKDCLALLPLRLRAGKSQWNRPVMRLMMGGRRYADYTGLLCRPEAEVVAIPALAEMIKRLPWNQWELEFLWCSERRLERLLDRFPKEQFRVTAQKTANLGETTDKAICPYLDLPGTWDEYLARLSHNTRQKLRRMMRAVEAKPELSITHATAETIERDIKILLQLWRDNWQEAKGDRLQAILQLSGAMLYRNYSTGSVDLAVMWSDRRPIAALALWVDERKKAVFSALAGRDETFENPSPGRVLQTHSIQRAIANGFTMYDLGRGNEPFKYWFGAVERRIKSIEIARRGPV